MTTPNTGELTFAQFLQDLHFSAVGHKYLQEGGDPQQDWGQSSWAVAMYDFCHAVSVHPQILLRLRCTLAQPMIALGFAKDHRPAEALAAGLTAAQEDIPSRATFRVQLRAWEACWDAVHEYQSSWHLLHASGEQGELHQQRCDQHKLWMDLASLVAQAVLPGTFCDASGQLPPPHWLVRAAQAEAFRCMRSGADPEETQRVFLWKAADVIREVVPWSELVVHLRSQYVGHVVRCRLAKNYVGQ